MILFIERRDVKIWGDDRTVSARVTAWWHWESRTLTVKCVRGYGLTSPGSNTFIGQRLTGESDRIRHFTATSRVDAIRKAIAEADDWFAYCGNEVVPVPAINGTQS